MTFEGVDVHLSNYLPSEKKWEQVRFPRSKRARIRRKWAKDTRRNWAWVEQPMAMKIAGVMTVNAPLWAQLQKLSGRAVGMKGLSPLRET